MVDYKIKGNLGGNYFIRILNIRKTYIGLYLFAGVQIIKDRE